MFNFIVLKKLAIMKLTKRLDEALYKLYNSFHDGTLNPECCNNCAVGNICNNTDSWKHFSNEHGSLQLNYVGLVHQNLGRTFFGYSPLDLLQIEAEFLKGCGYKIPLNHRNSKPDLSSNKENLFDGMCAAIELLCYFDKIDNVMDYYPILDKKVNLEVMEIV